MHRRWIEAALLVGLAATIAGPASAQQRQQSAQPSIISDEPDAAPPAAAPPAKSTRPRSSKPTPAFEHDPDLDAQDQFAPSQVLQQMPDAVAMPSGGGGGGHARAAARWR